MGNSEDHIKKLLLKMLRIQQGVYHSKQRVIIAFEGTDAAGKGGNIRKVTEVLDPRGLRVYPIGAPGEVEQGKHYLYRFWKRIPAKGMISIFDRTWYGRVLVERVDNLITKDAWKRAYDEINQFEKVLTDDGVRIIKIFLKISKKEQLKRFEERLKNPYKQWKLTDDDIKARSQWGDYAKAQKEMFEKTDTDYCPWHIVETDDKDEAREQVLKIITDKCSGIGEWMESKAFSMNADEIKKVLRDL